MRRVSIAFFILAVSVLACRTGSSERRLSLYPSPTSEATLTPFVVEITTTPAPTTYVIITATAKPTQTVVSIHLCVSAEKAVNLRPSASDDGYPILQLRKGDKVTDLGGRDENWMYVQYREKTGWVNKRYLGQCTKP